MKKHFWAFAGLAAVIAAIAAIAAKLLREKEERENGIYCDCCDDDFEAGDACCAHCDSEGEDEVSAPNESAAPADEEDDEQQA